jgi:hypothetical protein
MKIVPQIIQALYFKFKQAVNPDFLIRNSSHDGAS